tara:strand:- start:613 stop:780 length:168 start_codon:yes stop_codon:yes gene_type:complete
MAFKSYNFLKQTSVRLTRMNQYPPTIDPETGERIRNQDELERYNRTPVASYAIRY